MFPTNKCQEKGGPIQRRTFFTHACLLSCPHFADHPTRSEAPAASLSPAMFLDPDKHPPWSNYQHFITGNLVSISGLFSHPSLERKNSQIHIPLVFLRSMSTHLYSALSPFFRAPSSGTHRAVHGVRACLPCELGEGRLVWEWPETSVPPPFPPRPPRRDAFACAGPRKV
jgi:hypothetical protein